MSKLGRITQYISYSLIILCLAGLPAFAGELFVWQSLLATAVILVAAIIWTLGTVKMRKLPVPNLIDIALVVFLGLSLFSLTRSVYLHDSLVAVGQLIGYLLIFWLCQAMGRSEEWRWAAGAAVVVGGIIAAIWGLREYVQTVAAAGEVTWRIFGPFYNPNLLAGYLLLALPLAVGFLGWWRQRSTGPGHRLDLVTGTFIVMLLAAALLLTGSKGGLVAAVAVVIVLAITLHEPGTSTARRVRWLVGVGLVLGGLMALAVPPLRVRLLSAFTTESHSTAFRYLTWRGTLSMIGVRPLFGFGPGSFQYVYPRFAQAGFTRMAHQSFLQIAAETGAVSLAAIIVAFAAILWALAKRLRAIASTERPLIAASAAGFVGFLVHNLVDYSWYSPAVALTVWGLAGLALSTCAPRRYHPPLSGTGILPVSFRAIRLVILASLIVALMGAVWGLIAQSQAARASVLAKRGSYTEATRQIQRALRFDPLDAELWEDLANYQAAQAPATGGRALAEAIRARLRVAQLRPTDAPNYRYLAQLYAQAGDLPSAIAAARRAVREYPTYVQGWVTLGQIYQLSGSLKQAEESYQQVADIYRSPVYKYAPTKEYAQPIYVQAFYFLAKQAARRGESEQEYLYLVPAAKVLTNYLQQLPLRRQMMHVIGQWNEAEYEHLRRVAQQVAARLASRGEAGALMRAAELYLALDRPQRGQQILEELVAEAVGGRRLSTGERLFTGRGCVSLATLLNEQNNATEAERLLQQGLTLIEDGLEELSTGAEVAGWEKDDTDVAEYILVHHQLPGPEGRMALVKEERQ